MSVYSEWAENRKQDYFGSNYMKQFFEMCKEINADAYVITTLPSDYSICRKDKLLPSRIDRFHRTCKGQRFTWRWSTGLRVWLQN